ncbi:MAG: hypothetical protein RBS22_13695, partial [Spongiibacteraceae bacterium]|nr:hypothetical protein [Spongiibacteraceae bacterium]
MTNWAWLWNIDGLVDHPCRPALNGPACKPGTRRRFVQPRQTDKLLPEVGIMPGPTPAPDYLPAFNRL